MNFQELVYSCRLSVASCYLSAETAYLRALLWLATVNNAGGHSQSLREAIADVIDALHVGSAWLHEKLFPLILGRHGVERTQLREEP